MIHRDNERSLTRDVDCSHQHLQERKGKMTSWNFHISKPFVTKNDFKSTHSGAYEIVKVANYC